MSTVRINVPVVGVEEVDDAEAIVVISVNREYRPHVIPVEHLEKVLQRQYVEVTLSATEVN